MTSLGVDFGVYQNKTTDALLRIYPAASLGFSTFQLQNAGTVKNMGWELAMNAAIVDGSVRWSTTVSMDGNRNEIIDLGDQAVCGTSSVIGSTRTCSGASQVGKAPARGILALRGLGIRWPPGVLTEPSLLRRPAVTNGSGCGSPTAPRVRC